MRPGTAPLQNRVTPRNEIAATLSRDLFVGHGVCLHSDRVAVVRRWGRIPKVPQRPAFMADHREIMAAGIAGVSFSPNAGGPRGEGGAPIDGEGYPVANPRTGSVARGGSGMLGTARCGGGMDGASRRRTIRGRSASVPKACDSSISGQGSFRWGTTARAQFKLGPEWAQDGPISKSRHEAGF